MVALLASVASSSRHARGGHDLGPQPLARARHDLVESLLFAPLISPTDRSPCSAPGLRRSAKVLEAQIGGRGALQRRRRRGRLLVAAGRRRVGARLGGVRVSAVALMSCARSAAALLLGLAAG